MPLMELPRLKCLLAWGEKALEPSTLVVASAKKDRMAVTAAISIRVAPLVATPHMDFAIKQ